MHLERVDAGDPRLRRAHDACFPLDSRPSWSLGAWWLLCDDEHIAGFAGIQPSIRFIDCGYLVRAGVMPSYRGQNLQRRLIDVRVQYARRQQWAWVVSATYNNPASANNLIERGFRLYEPAVPWLAAGALYWRKPLCPHR